jgi:glyoxylase-like metal-dependent hydrolase (beta-lactamase superfamily II)
VRRRELGRGERVLPGVYRLRLPLPWPGVPHCNAWAVTAGEGVVLFDTGMHQPDSLAQLERALAMCELRLDDVRLVVCTHAHSDHCGQATAITQRAGCELWMHPNHEHMKRMAQDPDAVLDSRIEVARHSGVPEEPLSRWAAARRSKDSGIAGVIEPDRELRTGVRIDTDLGGWSVHETPGHAPSHVCLYQPQRRLLISGDHLLGRISLYFDFGWTPDPIGEFLSSLDVADKLGARLALSGHGKPFIDVHGHVEANRSLVRERLDLALAAVRHEPKPAIEIAASVFGPEVIGTALGWRLQETLCYLRHLEVEGLVFSESEGDLARWGVTTN